MQQAHAVRLSDDQQAVVGFADRIAKTIRGTLCLSVCLTGTAGFTSSCGVCICVGPCSSACVTDGMAGYVQVMMAWRAAFIRWHGQLLCRHTVSTKQLPCH